MAKRPFLNDVVNRQLSNYICEQIWCTKQITDAIIRLNCRNQLHHHIRIRRKKWSDDWPRWWLIDDRWKGPAFDKIVWSRHTDWNIISRPQWWWLIDDRYILHIGGLRITELIDNIWLSEISIIWFVHAIWPRVHEQKSRSSMINRSMGWDKIDILLWSYHWQTWLKTDKLDSNPTTVDGWRLDCDWLFISIKYVGDGQILERVRQKMGISEFILMACVKKLSAGHTGV